jgi:hypothetical protein
LLRDIEGIRHGSHLSHGNSGYGGPGAAMLPSTRTDWCEVLVDPGLGQIL